MSVQQLPPRASTARLEDALARIAQRAIELDRQPRFPTENFADLLAAGALTPPPDGLAGEARLVRAVAAADASTARILDGHLNGIERLTLTAPEPLRSTELARYKKASCCSAYGAQTQPPARGHPPGSSTADGQPVLRGVKTFCSGAGGVQRALILAADHDGSRRLVYLDTTSSQISIDRGWYQASGLRASESHRVEFHDTPILAVLGGPGELSREPYFSRDAHPHLRHLGRARRQHHARDPQRARPRPNRRGTSPHARQDARRAKHDRPLARAHHHQPQPAR